MKIEMKTSPYKHMTYKNYSLLPQKKSNELTQIVNLLQERYLNFCYNRSDHPKEEKLIARFISQYFSFDRSSTTSRFSDRL